MKSHSYLFAGALLAGCLPLQTWAQGTSWPITPGARTNAPVISAQSAYGPDTDRTPITEVLVVNYDGEVLGRIQDLTLDLTNGRVVQVLVVSGQFLRLGGKTVAVPPEALANDRVGKVYRLDVTAAEFKAAPAFNLDKVAESTRPESVAASYRYFGWEPYFVVPGAPADASAGQYLRRLGPIERMSNILNMQVYNLSGERMGRLQTLLLDVPSGRITKAYIHSSFTPATEALREYSTIVPPTALGFNAEREQLVLDMSKAVYGEQPHVVFRVSDGKIADVSEQPSAPPPPPLVVARYPGSRPYYAVAASSQTALVQGTSARDIEATAQIYRAIQNGQLDYPGRIEVATLQGRVTLRGSVISQAAKDSIGAIADTAPNIYDVDNQIIVAPLQASL